MQMTMGTRTTLSGILGASNAYRGEARESVWGVTYPHDQKSAIEGLPARGVRTQASAPALARGALTGRLVWDRDDFGDRTHSGVIESPPGTAVATFENYTRSGAGEPGSHRPFATPADEARDSVDVHYDLDPKTGTAVNISVDPKAPPAFQRFFGR